MFNNRGRFLYVVLVRKIRAGHLYELRDHKIGKIETVYTHFANELKKEDKVNFKEWDKKQGNKKHAFNVKRT